GAGGQRTVADQPETGALTALPLVAAAGRHEQERRGCRRGERGASGQRRRVHCPLSFCWVRDGWRHATRSHVTGVSHGCPAGSVSKRGLPRDLLPTIVMDRTEARRRR